jgi:hypothetical protein
LQPLVTSFLHVDGAVRSFTTNTLATQGVFTNARHRLFLSNQSFCFRVTPPSVDDHFTVTVIYSSGTADAENPAKTTECMVNSALKW